MIKREEFKKKIDEKVKNEPKSILLHDRTRILESELTEEIEERETEFGFQQR